MSKAPSAAESPRGVLENSTFLGFLFNMTTRSERDKEYSRRYYQEHKKKILVRQKVYRVKNFSTRRLSRKVYDRKYYATHRKKYCAYSKIYTKDHAEQVRQRGIRRRAKMRNLILQNYGDRCEYCGESRVRLLVVDHTDGKGFEHRKKIGQNTYTLYRWLIRNSYPEGFQILCNRCNLLKGNRPFHCPCCPNNFRKSKQ